MAKGMTTEEIFNRDFDYWIGCTFSKGVDVAPKDRPLFLTILKEKYINLLFDFQKIHAELIKSDENNFLLKKEIEELRKLNSELTEENIKLSEEKNEN